MEDESETIMRIAREIYKNAISGKKRAELMTEYNEFYEKYPKVFEACLRPDFDFSMLEFMLASREKIRTQKQDVNAVDADVIGHLKEFYVNPLLRKMNIPTDQEPDPELLSKLQKAIEKQLNDAVSEK